MVLALCLYASGYNRTILSYYAMLREIDVQPKDRVVFVHIPKTAGITFSTIFHPLLAGLPWCPVILSQDLVQMPYEEILRYQLFTGHFYFELVNKLFPSGFLFMTFLREPVSRTISHYEYLKRQVSFGKFDYANDELALAKQMSLSEFVQSDQLHIALDITDIQTKYIGGAGQPKTSIAENETEISIEQFMRNVSREMNFAPLPVNEYRFANKENLEQAKRQLERAAFFGITERFQDSLFLMSFIFGWPPVLDSLHLNHKLKTEHTQEPERDTLELIKSKVLLDLELYQFGQTLFEQRFKEMTEYLVKKYAGPEIVELDKPLNNEIICKLLQKHYEDRRNYRNQQILRTIGLIYHYSPAEHCEGGFGWHTVEKSSAHGEMVWSGPGLESGFDLPCPRGNNIQITFRVLMAIKSEIIQKLSLRVNDIPINLQYQNDSQGAFVFSGQLPTKAISGSFLRLVFSVPYTIAPYDVTPDNKDQRLLGFLLNWLKLDAQYKHAKRKI